jgi:hypothetical protein
VLGSQGCVCLCVCVFVWSMTRLSLSECILSKSLGERCRSLVTGKACFTGYKHVEKTPHSQSKSLCTVCMPTLS